MFFFNETIRWNEFHSLSRVYQFLFILLPQKRPAIKISINFFLFIFIYFLFFSDVIREESIQRAKFLELNKGHERNNKFGDVINLANGKLGTDQNGYFQLVEMIDNCIEYCLEETLEGHNITAFWSVYRVRHRDVQRSYRYEWKITIRRLRNSLRYEGKRNTEHNTNVRSFLIRDQDYPQYFENSTKKKEIKMEKRIFNTLYDKSEHPFNLDYRTQPSQYVRDVENLNIGEYYAKGSAPIIRYQVRNPQEAPLTAENANHLHHHYYLNKDEVPIFKTSHFEKVSAFPGHYNALNFPNNVVQPSQVSVPRVRNQLDSYSELLQTTSQAPFHFPEEIKLQETIRPTTYRGHYDDNRESILEGEVKKNNFEHHHNRNQLITFPARHANVLPISSITTTPSSYAIHLSTSPPTSSIPLLYDKQFSNPNSFHSPDTQGHANQYWYGQHPHHNSYHFVGSYPYHEHTYSELDPIYHGQSVLSTPSDVPPSNIPEINSEIHNGDDRFVSQLPLQNVGDDSSYDIPTEVHQTTSTNTDATFTTPYNAVTTIRADIIQSDDNNNPFPDSINAQLPPPDSGADLRVPYVETDKSSSGAQSHHKKKKEKYRVTIHDINDEDDDHNDDNEDVTIEKQRIEKLVDRTTKKSLQSRYKNRRSSSSTEKPSWAPKRPRLRGSDKYKTNSELVLKNSQKKSTYSNRRKITLRKATTTTEPTTITQEFSNESEAVSTTVASLLDDEPRTSQSVQKSVSVHIAEKVTVIPKKAAKLVINSKKGEIKKPRRVAKIKKVQKSVEDSTEHTLEQ